MKAEPGFVENCINLEQQRVESGYHRIFVEEEQGDEVLLDTYDAFLGKENPIAAVYALFENDKELVITEEQLVKHPAVSFEHFFFCRRLLQTVISKNATLHLRVKKDRIKAIKESFAIELAGLKAKTCALNSFLIHDKEYLITLEHIRKRSGKDVIRLYEDGSGFIVRSDYHEIFDANAPLNARLRQEDISIRYFWLSAESIKRFISGADEKVKAIVENPIDWHQTDYFTPYQLEYNLWRLFPDADHVLPEGKMYERVESAEDYNAIPLAVSLVQEEAVKLQMQSIITEKERK